MLKRKIESVLQRWSASEKPKALCIFGARQVGKTTSVEEFAKNHYECLIKIDFIETPQAAAIFDQGQSPQEILEQIELFSRQTIIPQKTLILLDEIQECPQARTAVKYLVQEGSCRYVETGSLLGVRLSQIRSLPVGYEELVDMYPLDFEEFLWANQVSENTINRLRECFEKKFPVPPFVHEELKKVFLTYIAVGGMPEAVSSYIAHHSVHQCVQILKNLWTQYGYDITKYADRSEIPKILDIFNSVPSQLCSSSARFYLSTAAEKKKVRFESYQSSLSWLSQAGIVLPCFNTSQPVFPLKLNEKRRLFRLYMLDTGLLCSQIPDIQLSLLKQESELNWGTVLENAAAQALIANGFELYYYNDKKIGELDFVIEQNSRISLIEMKSGTDYHRHSALDHALNVKNWPIHNAYVFCSGNIETDGTILYLPWYMLFLLKKDQQPDAYPSLNLDALEFE